MNNPAKPCILKFKALSTVYGADFKQMIQSSTLICCKAPTNSETHEELLCQNCDRGKQFGRRHITGNRTEILTLGYHRLHNVQVLPERKVAKGTFSLTS